MLIITTDNEIWGCDITLNVNKPADSEDRHVTKKPRLNREFEVNYKKLFTAENLLGWVQPMHNKIYTFSAKSNCVYIYNFETLTVEIINMPIKIQHIFSNYQPTCYRLVGFHAEENSNNAHQLDIIFSEHFGISCMNGVFIGFNNGCVYFLSQNESLNDLVLVSQLQFESVMLIHFCNLINTETSITNTRDTFILIGSGGTVQVYFKTALNSSQNIVYFKEFTIPPSIVSITAFKDAPALLISCKNDQLYYIEFKPQVDLPNKSGNGSKSKDKSKNN
ncbi:hypothetical protein BJ944DRAFT_108215 [Cunninghamella echinulata]|nr:hypothetical protein BJ944DRAFT_108215 [Cunninghamella echinulata]